MAPMWTNNTNKLGLMNTRKDPLPYNLLSFPWGSVQCFMTLPEVSSSGGAAEALICHSTRVLEPEKAFPSNMETKASH